MDQDGLNQGNDANPEFGCAACWGDDPVAVYDNKHSGLELCKSLVSESHFMVSVQQCRACRQLFASVFTEFIDWVNGQDPQYRTLVPITTAEADDLISERKDVFSIGKLGAGRRVLYNDWPSSGERRVYFSSGEFRVSEGE